MRGAPGTAFMPPSLAFTFSRIAALQAAIDPLALQLLSCSATVMSMTIVCVQNGAHSSGASSTHRHMQRLLQRCVRHNEQYSAGKMSRTV
eukprot:20937-Heterococcus_DN1.PRE.2